MFIFKYLKFQNIHGRRILKQCNFHLVICDAIFEAVITNKFQLQLAMTKLWVAKDFSMQCVSFLLAEIS